MGDAATDTGTTCADGCLVDSTCYAAGELDSTNACMICDPATSATALSPNDGATCDDGLYCTVGDVCAAGACGGATRECDDAIACNGTGTCDEAAAACMAGTPTCTAGQLCDLATDSCVATCTGCVIDGLCYGTDQANPANGCEKCAPAESATAWSPNDGASCDDGLFCTAGDACAAGACVGGAAPSCDDGVACNGAETCDEAADSCVLGSGTCGTGEVCDVATDACVTTCGGCVIGGVCYAAGTVNPSDACLACDPSASATDWTIASGATCDDGSFCTVSDTCSAAGVCMGGARDCGDGITCNGTEVCDDTTNRCESGSTTCGATEVCDPTADVCRVTCSGCVIGGTCYAAGTPNPGGPCETCDPSSSASDWTVTTGVACDDGLYCTTGETCTAAAVCTGGSARVCDDGVSCNGTETCDESVGSCAPGSTTCGAGELCDTTTDMCELSCGGGTELCSGMCVNTDLDPLHCGGCDIPCSLPNTTSAFCASGACGVATCATGFGNCDGVASTGCETNTNIDDNNCGGCGIICGADEVCGAGICTTDRIVFVTSTVVTANIGGLAGADARCQTLADAEGIGGTFRAWLSSSSVSAASRLSHSTGRYVLVDGTVVADNWTDLTDGSVDNFINLTESGGAPPPADPIILGEPTVWTGSTPSGGIAGSGDQCVDWTVASGSGHAMTEGRVDRTDTAWTQSRTWSGSPCGWERPLYCIQQ